MSSVICRTCGSELPAGESECPRCGTPVVVPAAPAGVGENDRTLVGQPGRGLAAGAPGAAPPSNMAPAVPAVGAPAVGASGMGTAPVAPAGVPQPAAGAELTTRVLTPVAQEQLESFIRNAHIVLRRNNLRMARELAEQAHALAPDHPLVHELNGILLETEGDEISAYKEYRLACRVKPEPPEAELRLARLTLRLPPETLAMLQPPRVQAGAEALPEEVQARLTAQERAALASMPLTALPRQRHATAASFASLVIPGFGQIVNEQYLKAVIMFVIWLFCVLWVIAIAHNSTRGNPAYNDPSIWVAVGIMVIDYLWSIFDARAK